MYSLFSIWCSSSFSYKPRSFFLLRFWSYMQLVCLLFLFWHGECCLRSPLCQRCRIDIHKIQSKSQFTTCKCCVWTKVYIRWAKRDSTTDTSLVPSYMKRIPAHYRYIPRAQPWVVIFSWFFILIAWFHLPHLWFIDDYIFLHCSSCI